MAWPSVMPGAQTGFFRRHAPADVLLREHIQVGLDLLLEVLVRHR